MGVLLVMATTVVPPGEIVHVVGAQQVGGGVVGDARADRRVGARIDDEVVAEGEDPPRVVEPDLGVVDVVARMGGVEDVLVAVLHPAHRPADPAGEPGDYQVFRVDMPLAAEPAADIGRQHPDLLLRHAEREGELLPDPVNDLGRRPDGERVRPPVVLGGHAPAFERHRGVTVVPDAPPDAVRRGRHRGGDVALLDVELGDRVGAEIGMDDRRVRRGCRFGIDDRRQRLEPGIDRLDGVLGRVAAVGADHGEGLAHIAHPVARHQVLRRQGNSMIDPLRPALRRGDLHAADGGHLARQFGAAQREDRAGLRQRPGEVDGNDPRMGELAPREGGMDHARQDEVGDVGPLAQQEAPVLAPGDRAADIAGGRGGGHRSPPLAYSATAWTMPS